MMGTPSRLWHTLRWLKPVQFYGRAWHRLYRPRPDLSSAAPVRLADRPWQPCARRVSMVGPGEFRFLNETRHVRVADDWSRGDWPKLWLYNLHYFDDLCADRAQERGQWHRMYIDRWIAENPPGHGTGWEPYPLSLRTVNWIKAANAHLRLDQSANDSLAVQARWLTRRLERHLLGNHVWANAKALVFAGTYFCGAQSRRWRETGLWILRQQMREQILADGGHFERSPMYHCIVLEDLLDLIQLNRTYPGVLDAKDVAAWRAGAAKMLQALQVLTHADGQIALLNDAAFDIAPSPSELRTYARCLGVESHEMALGAVHELGESGYVRMAAGQATLIADVGLVGPDYIPGHAHADTLGFEFSLRKQRVFVDAGTSTYGASAVRLQQRGTLAHNTVCVDGKDSSEVWSSFRVARRARPIDVRHGSDGQTVWLTAGHDGYRRLPGKVTHRRRWLLEKQRLSVVDTLEGRFRTAVARFRLHPALSVSAKPDGTGGIVGGGHELRWVSEGAATARVVHDHWYPAFGIAVPCQVLELQFDGPQLAVKFEWDQE